MKILFISNITGKKVGSFAMASIMASKELEYEYHLAANFKNSSPEQMKKDEEEYGIHLHQIDFERNPLKPANLNAYKQVVELINREKIDVIHCNTPIGGIVGRLAGKKCGVKRVIYQAHGFHFYKGAPKKNWLLYYPVEKWLAHYTDALITINNEDYELAKSKLKLRNTGKVYYVPGVGIELDKYADLPSKREHKRNEMGVEDEVVFISMGDLIPRKNYETAIRAISNSGCSNVQYWICGAGPEENNLKQLTEKLNVTQHVRFLGFRTDIIELLSAADVFVLTSYQEGLPRSTSEAMASGLPCLISSIRGNTDLIENGKGGWICNPDDINEFAKGIRELVQRSELRSGMRDYNLMRIHQFDLKTVISAIKEIYCSEFLSSNI